MVRDLTGPSFSLRLKHAIRTWKHLLLDALRAADDVAPRTAHPLTGEEVFERKLDEDLLDEFVGAEDFVDRGGHLAWSDGCELGIVSELATVADVLGMICWISSNGRGFEELGVSMVKE